MRYAWRRHGPLGAVRLAGSNLAYYLRRDRSTANTSHRPDPFDAEYGTDTAGFREIGSLDVIKAASARSAVRYQPSDGALVRSALERLAIDYEGYSFVDFGSGKGRVLLVAAGFAFKAVIGVEFSRELHEIALRNIAAVPADRLCARRICSLNRDAASFEPPPGDLVCYLYNPFGPPIISEVTARLAAHYRQNGCRIIVVYVDPQHRRAFEATGTFLTLWETPHILVLTTPPAAIAADRVLTPPPQPLC